MIWCVEDDASIRDIEVYALQTTGFEARGFEDGLAFWNAILACENPQSRPELIILDIMLPSLDGIELLRRLKTTPVFAGIPVIMATAKGSEYDKVRGLDMGADYYLAKPFGVMELVSCVKAVLRRYKNVEPTNVLTFKDLRLNLDERTTKLKGEDIPLTFKEFELLKLFLSNPGMIYSRDKLFNEIWGFEYYGESRTVDMHIRTLRQKLGSYGNLIRTVRNVGYGLDSSFNPNSAAIEPCEEDK
jgi:two-component system, OmpR family, alkaline phosphatase synthesis response regulator PhoP